VARPPLSPPDAVDFVSTDAPIDLRLTLAPLAHGRGDPTIRFDENAIWRATRTPSGAATLRLRSAPGGVEVSAWGPGGEAAVADAADLVGAHDAPERLVAHHRIIADLVRRRPGLRLPRTNRAFEAVLPAICEQKVTGKEAQAAFRGIVMAFGEPAPGPTDLRLPPAAATLATVPYFRLHPLGLERRRADVVAVVARLAPRLEGAADAEVLARLRAVSGIGPWTLAEVGRIAFGDPDAVSIGDYHLPNLVAWALAGEPRADDARMLELLAPYEGQRGRVQRLLEVSGLRAPRYGPRMASRRMAGI